jgi:pyrimidine-nucleoside phosphorylase
MNIVELIQRKRDGEELSAEEIKAVITGYSQGEITDFQMGSLLMSVYFNGLSDQEVTSATQAMVESGSVLDLSSVPGIKVDKHSTGGVGDKTSLIAAPLAAAAGVKVPMAATRAYGFLGGTLDKLEAIPQFRTNLTYQEMCAQLAQVGLCFVGGFENTAPASDRIFALRDLTATVESLPLMACTAMAREIAMGIDCLVVDVKVGSGAYVKTQLEARRLGQMMVTVGRRMNKRVQALITSMDQPLGYAIGNALEIMEVSQTLQNAGPGDLTRLSLELAARMIYLAQLANSVEEARLIAQDRLLDFSGYEKFKEAIVAQGGDPQVLDRFELLPNASGVRDITSPRTGYITTIDADEIGRAVAIMGGGRLSKDDPIDHAVGVVLEVKCGEKVETGAILCRLYYTREDQVEDAADMVEGAFRISASEPEEKELLLETVS